MQETSRPLVVLYGYRSKKRALSFIGRAGHVTLHGRIDIVEKILRLCTGFKSVQDIIKSLPLVDKNAIAELIDLCEAEGIVRDSRELHEGFHEDSANPTTFSHDLGFAEVGRLMNAERLRSRNGKAVQLPRPGKSGVLEAVGFRQSTRTFQDGCVPGEILSGLLEATYGIGTQMHWSVPSGGALHPLDVYLIVPSRVQTISLGTYRWSPETHELRMISDKDPNVWLRKAFNAKALLEHAACIVCIAANLRRSTAKYANRGYRYALLEAGHAAQNAYLYCAEKKLGIVEYGGFHDAPLARELELNYSNEAVITTLIVGVPDSTGRPSWPTADLQMTEMAFQLRHALVGEGKPMECVFFWEPIVNGYAMPRLAAMASYNPPYDHAKASDRERSRSSGIGYTSSEAEIKALAEGFERYATERIRVDCIQSAKDLKEPFLDPRQAVPYSSRQFKFLNRLDPFDPLRKMDWVAGKMASLNERIWVPAELVFYGPTVLRRPGRKPCYLANSSGVAAHYDAHKAVENALYELVERDAIGVTWYTKRRVYAMAHPALPGELQERIARWNGLGFRVSILDLTLDGPPVAVAIIWSPKKTPALIAGAGSRPTFHEAAIRSFDEAELLAMSWNRRRPRRDMKASDVKTVTDHGSFYIDPRNLIHARWLIEAEEKVDPPDDFNGDWSPFDPVIIDITPNDHVCGLTVVRALSAKLLPINFGYGTEHYRHQRIARLGLRWSTRYPAIPHFFA